MAIPFIAFWAIAFIARDELGWKGFALCVLLWAGLLAACLFLAGSLYLFVALQSLFDIILLLALFGHDIRIR